jgi:hypothetical protein
MCTVYSVCGDEVQLNVVLYADLYQKFMTTVQRMVKDEITGIRLWAPKSYETEKSKGPNYLQKFIVAQVFKEFIVLPISMAERLLNDMLDGEFINFLSVYLSPQAKIPDLRGAHLGLRMKHACYILRMQPTIRFWMHAIVEDVCQNAGQIPVPSHEVRPVMTYQRMVEILKYDPAVMPPAERRSDLFTNTKIASTSGKWPKRGENDFISLLSWRYLQHICEMEHVVRANSLRNSLASTDIHFHMTPRCRLQEYEQSLEDLLNNGPKVPDVAEVLEIWNMRPAYVTDKPKQNYEEFQKQPYSNASLQGRPGVAAAVPPLTGHNRKYFMTGIECNVGMNSLGLNLNMTWLDGIKQTLTNWVIRSGLGTFQIAHIEPGSFRSQVTTSQILSYQSVYMCKHFIEMHFIIS